ncbi:hypothetical protein [Algimonas ampicilliniresistens]|nr:hypothetical protein [Algimonas ampicilliniresistens]
MTRKGNLSLFDEIFALVKTGALRLRSWTLRLALFTCVLILPASILLIVIGQPWVAPKWMFFDSLTAAEFSDDCCHIYYGFVSNLGIFLWIGTAAIALFSAVLFAMIPQLRRYFGFALSAGILSGWLGLDDAFLLHEVAFPELGVPQIAVLGSYLILALIYGLVSWRTLLSSEFWLLGLAAFGVGTSLAVDVILHSIDDTVIIIEDSAKFMGLFSWFAFHALTYLLILTSSWTTPRTPKSS